MFFFWFCVFVQGLVMRRVSNSKAVPIYMFAISLAARPLKMARRPASIPAAEGRPASKALSRVTNFPLGIPSARKVLANLNLKTDLSPEVTTFPCRERERAAA